MIRFQLLFNYLFFSLLQSSSMCLISTMVSSVLQHWSQSKSCTGAGLPPLSLADWSATSSLRFVGDILWTGTVINVGSTRRLREGNTSFRTYLPAEFTKCSLNTRLLSFTGKFFWPILCIHTFSSFLFFNGSRWSVKPGFLTELLLHPGTQQNEPLSIILSNKRAMPYSIISNVLTYRYENAPIGMYRNAFSTECIFHMENALWNRLIGCGSVGDRGYHSVGGWTFWNAASSYSSGRYRWNSAMLSDLQNIVSWFLPFLRLFVPYNITS